MIIGVLTCYINIVEHEEKIMIYVKCIGVKNQDGEKNRFDCNVFSNCLQP